MMKICFISFSFYVPEHVLAPLYEYSQIMSKKGHQVTVFVRQHKENILSNDRLEIKTVCKEFFIRKITHLIFLLKLISILKKERFDIVHIFNFPGVSLLPIFCKKKNRKWFMDVQSVTEEAGLKGIFYDNLTFLESMPFDGINVLNERMKNKLFGNKLLKKVKIVPLGANLKRFEEAKCDRSIWKTCGIKENDFILVYIGQLDEHRRLKNVLDAFRIIDERFKNKNIKLVFIGGKDDEIKKLRDKANSNFIAGKVFFLGLVSYERIPCFLKSADMGIAYIPKTVSYNIQPPLKTFEYLAASLPVVATNTDANLDILKDEVNGIVTSDKPEDFAEGVLKLLNNDGLMLKLKRGAVDSIKSYDWEDIVDTVVRIYSS